MPDRLTELLKEYQQAWADEVAAREQLKIKEANSRKVLGEINDLMLAEQKAKAKP